LCQQNNAQIDIVDRKAGKPVSSFGSIGKQPGQFIRRMALRWTPRATSMLRKTAAGGCHKFKIVSETRAETMARRTFPWLVAAAAMLAATAALSRPFLIRAPKNRGY